MDGSCFTDFVEWLRLFWCFNAPRTNMIYIYLTPWIEVIEHFMKLSVVFPLLLEELTFFCYLVKFWVSLFVQWNCLHMDLLSSELLRWSNWLWEQEVIQDCSLTGTTICFWHKWRAAHGECIFCIPTDALRSSLEGMSAACAWEMKTKQEGNVHSPQGNTSVSWQGTLENIISMVLWTPLM